MAQIGLLVLKEGRHVLSAGIEIGGAGEGVAPPLKSAWGRTRGAKGEAIDKGDIPEEAAAAAAAAIGDSSVAAFSRK